MPEVPIDFNNVIYRGFEEDEVGGKDYIFEYENFLYKVRTFDNIVSHFMTQKPYDLKTNGDSLTEDDIILNTERRRLYNHNHQLVQDWINTLI